MKNFKFYYIFLVIIAFVIGTQVNIEFKTSQVITSDVIAVVNNDQKVDYLDSTLRLGDNLTDQLTNSESKYQFQVTSSPEASQGLLSGKYGAKITIPSNFTAGITSINSDKPIATELTFDLSDNLSASKANKIEDVIISNISKFEDNVTYMYIYSIFDNLHTSQEGITQVVENSQPVFTFLEEISDINIVDNHEYELEDINTDSFDSIDISQQLSDFKMTVSDYKNKVAQIIEVYRDENSQYNVLVDESLGIMSENDELLNDRIENVEDTLDTIVSSNQQYTSEDYSITNTRGNLGSIIVGYFNQLMVVNDQIDLNASIDTQIGILDEGYSQLAGNDLYKSLEDAIGYRNLYYQSLNGIVEQCLSQSNPGASDCISQRIEQYRSNYNSYEGIINQLDTEKKYYETMTYYLEHVNETTRSKTTTGPRDFPIEMETVDNKEPESQSEVEVTPQMQIENFSSSTSESNLFAINLTNLEDTSSLSIDITNELNISSIEFIPSGIENVEVSIDESRIQIHNIANSQLSLLFKADKVVESEMASLEFEYDDSKIEISFTEKSPLVSTITTEGQTVIANYQYTLQNNNQGAEITNSSLIDKYNNIVIETTGGDRVTATDSGFLIDGLGLIAGQVINFKVTYTEPKDNQLITQEEYDLEGTNYQVPIISEEFHLDTELVISDDQYSADGSLGENDDIDGNNQFEPNENTGIEYNIAITSGEQFTLSGLSFELNLPQTVYPIVENSNIFVAGNSTTISITDNVVTIDLNSELSSVLNSAGNNELELAIVVNVTTNSEIQLEDLQTNPVVNIKNLQPIINETAYSSESSNSEEVDIAFGSPEITSFVYTTSAESCQGAVNLPDCSFEAGEVLSKTIVIENTGETTAAGLNLTDEFTNNDLSITFNSSVSDLVLDTPLDPSIDTGQYVENLIDTSTPENIKFSLPPNSTLTITEDMTIPEIIDEDTEVIESIKLSQYGIDISQGGSTLAITPIKLILEKVSDRQITEDGVITPGESAEIELELTNASVHATSTNQVLKVTPSDSTAISSIDVQAVEDQNWNPVISSPSGTNGIIINHSLAPNQYLRIKLRINFTDLATSSNLETLTFTASSGETSVESSSLDVNYNLATNINYLDLARQQANTGVMFDSNKTYSDTYNDSSELATEAEDIKNASDALIGLEPAIPEINQLLGTFTVLSNEDIDQVVGMITDPEFGFDSDGNQLSKFDLEYCQLNSEISCKLFKLYNKIYRKEAEAKSHFLNILNTIDPTIDQVIELKPTGDEEGQQQPANIGADFNGYGDCAQTDIEVECQLQEPGIKERIRLQKDNIDSVEENIDQILDNELMEVDAEPYTTRLTEINESTNQEMSAVEETNNQLFDEKIDGYNQNYENIMTYVQEINDDPEYQEAIEDFGDAELTRQEQSQVVLEYVYNLMPNTYLEGLPNRIVYSFIADPLQVAKESDVANTQIASESSNKLLLIVLGSITIILGLLIAAFYWVIKEV